MSTLKNTPHLGIRAVTCFLVQDGLLLLQERPQGKLWGGMLNGPGGKVEASESSEEALVREIQEETALHLCKFEARGNVELLLPSPKPMLLTVDIFVSQDFAGEPTAGEGHLSWHPKNQLPFRRMWPDQRYWLPAILDGYSVTAKLQYAPEEFRISKMDIRLR